MLLRLGAAPLARLPLRRRPLGCGRYRREATEQGDVRATSPENALTYYAVSDLSRGVRARSAHADHRVVVGGLARRHRRATDFGAAIQDGARRSHRTVARAARTG